MCHSSAQGVLFLFVLCIYLFLFKLLHWLLSLSHLFFSLVWKFYYLQFMSSGFIFPVSYLFFLKIFISSFFLFVCFLSMIWFIFFTWHFSHYIISSKRIFSFSIDLHKFFSHSMFTWFEKDCSWASDSLNFVVFVVHIVICSSSSFIFWQKPTGYGHFPYNSFSGSEFLRLHCYFHWD